jgi:glycosyltransferase involved in cell wall biosynthesis
MGIPINDIRLAPSMTDPQLVVRLGGEGSIDELVVGAVGTANRQKGFDLWLDVVRRVAARVPKAAFIWLGDVPRGSVQGLVAEMGLGDRLRLQPGVANPYPVMRAFALFTLPSREESAGLAVQEAMALGLPIVSFALPSVVEQLGDAGRTVPPLDTAAMAAEIERLLDDESERRALGDRARARAFATFSGERYAATVRTIVAETLPGRGGDGWNDPPGDTVL